MAEAASPEVLKELFARIGELKSPKRVLAASLEARERFGDHGYLRFLSGRACVEQDDLEAAREHLVRSLQLTPGFLWAQYELARTLLRLDQVAEAAPHVAGFLDQVRKPLNEHQQQVVERVLDRWFMEAPRAVATRLYARLVALGARRPLTVLRAFEGHVDRADVDAAAALLPQLGQPVDPWGQLALARFSALAGRKEELAFHLRSAAELAPDNAFVANACAQLVRVSDNAALADALIALWQGRFEGPAFALLVVSASRQAIEAAVLIEALKAREATRWPFVEHLYRLAAHASADEVQATAEAVERRFPDDADVLLCRVNLDMRLRQFAEARARCRQALACATTDEMRASLVFKEFELACFDGELERAGDLLETLDATRFDAAQQLAVTRFHAELGAWDEACERMLAMLAGDDGAAGERAAPAALTDDAVELSIRALRKAGAHRRGLEALAALAPLADPGRVRVAAALFADWMMTPEATPALARTLRERLALPVNGLMRLRLSATPTLLAAPEDAAPAPRRAVYFCADRAYLMPALVSLASLLENNPRLRAADFYVVVDASLVETARVPLATLCEHHGVRGFVESTDTLLREDASLATRYGLFTGGHQLARSAYYRIYMARHLAESGRYDELLYVDSDTVIGPGFEDLFDAPRGDDALLLARLEIDRAEVREAIRVHGLDDGRYFNSGVLYFPRVGAPLVRRLREVEAIAENPESRLFFQDQCALNLGFAKAFEALAPRFNFFAGPNDLERVQRTPQAEAAMLHALDRPKPWDAAYPAETLIQRRWLQAAHALERVLGAGAMRELLVMSI
jgi:lipopolysaccharide biosynthesis glycosyltransferase